MVVTGDHPATAAGLILALTGAGSLVHLAALDQAALSTVTVLVAAAVSAAWAIERALHLSRRL